MLLSCVHRSGHQGETANSFLATLASSTSEEMEAELQERVESSQKQASRVMEIYERLKGTVDQLQAELDSGVGERRRVRVSVNEYMMTVLRWSMDEYSTCAQESHPACIGYILNCWFLFQREVCGR